MCASPFNLSEEDIYSRRNRAIQLRVMAWYQDLLNGLVPESNRLISAETFS